MGLFTVFVRHVCEADHSHTCNNVTRHVVTDHSIRVLRAVQLHYFITTSLNWVLLKLLCRTDSTDILDTRRNLYSLEFQTTKFLLHKSLLCHFTERSIDVSPRNINGARAVNCVMAATINIKPVHFPLFLSDNCVLH